MLEGSADDALGAPAGEHVALDDRLVLRPGVEAPAHRRVLAFGILAEDDHVDVSRLLARQGRSHAGIQVSRADADALVEAPAHRQQQPLQGDVVRNVRVAHRAEQDGVEAGQ